MKQLTGSGYLYNPSRKADSFKSGGAKTTAGKRKLEETEPETDILSDALTGNLDGGSAAVSSDLSSIEDVVEATPRPKKKSRPDNDSNVVPAKAPVSQVRRVTTATNSGTKAQIKDKRPPASGARIM